MKITKMATMMAHAIEMSYYKYGTARKTYPELAQAHKCIEERLDYYENGRPSRCIAPHNKDYVIDVANFAMLEAILEHVCHVSIRKTDLVHESDIFDVALLLGEPADDNTLLTGSVIEFAVRAVGVVGSLFADGKDIFDQVFTRLIVERDGLNIVWDILSGEILSHCALEPHHVVLVEGADELDRQVFRRLADVRRDVVGFVFSVNNSKIQGSVCDLLFNRIVSFFHFLHPFIVSVGFS